MVNLSREEKKKQKNLLFNDAIKKDCNVCPLKDADIESPCMRPSGSNRPILYIIGEAPGREEDERDTQFVGRSGQLLRYELNILIG